MGIIKIIQNNGLQIYDPEHTKNFIEMSEEIISPFFYSSSLDWLITLVCLQQRNVLLLLFYLHLQFFFVIFVIDISFVAYIEYQITLVC